MLRDHIYSYDHITIGSDLDAVIYAYKTGSLFINNAVVRIFPYDTISHPIDLGLTHFRPGTPKIEIYQELSYRLNMQGQNFLGHDVESISLNLEENELSVSSKIFRPKKIKFSTLTLFDTENVFGAPNERPRIKAYQVFDWFHVRSGMKHEFDILESESDFVRKIHFYLSSRIDGNRLLKDLVAESLMTESQIHNVDYSDSLARLKVLSMMKEAGIRGPANGSGKNLSLKIELAERQVFPIKSFFKHVILGKENEV